MTDSEPDEPGPASTARGIAILRLAFVGVALVQILAAGAHADARLFAAVLALFAGYAVLAFTRARQVSPPLALLTDLALLAALVYASGGGRSPLRFAFALLPLAAALRLAPRTALAFSAAVAGTYLAVALARGGAAGSTAAEVLGLAWIGAAAAMLSQLIRLRELRLRTLAVQSFDAEARERRRLAQALHDDAIQNVLLARQEVADAARGVPEAAARARDALDAVHRQLRDEAFKMHPVGLERAGLAAVLRSFAEDAGRRGRFRARVEVDPAAAGVHDDLLMSTARELLANAARHAMAGSVEVRVRVEGGRVRLTVSDDGGGFAAERLEQARAAGHIGLASLAERIRAVGGDMAIDSGLGRGTVVDAHLPPPG